METVTEETVKEQRERRRKESRVESHRQRHNNDALLIEFQPDAVEIEERSIPGVLLLLSFCGRVGRRSTKSLPHRASW
jgi:hypothetical protein